jgi:uncharacterized membrane protein YdjX (TVP38/TMEM64 family)
MERNILKKRVFLILFIIVMWIALWLSVENYINFDVLKKNSDVLKEFVHTHYIESVLIFILIFISTAFFVPVAIISTIAAGFLFGVVMGTIYVNIGSTIGATMAFLSARYLFGHRVQLRYEKQLKIFNEEIARHGLAYLFVLRITPVLPFFLINYLSGLTKISTKKFILITLLSMLPGSVVYTFAGQKLGMLRSPRDAFSFEIFIVFGFIALLVLLPAIVTHGKNLRNRYF